MSSGRKVVQYISLDRYLEGLTVETSENEDIIGIMISKYLQDSFELRDPQSEKLLAGYF